MEPSPNGGANSTVHRKSGTCSSVSLVLRRAAHQTARPATSIPTLRCKTLPEQVRQRLTDALTHNRPTPPAPALIGKSGQGTVSGFASHRLLLANHPWPLKGKIITREREYQRERRCPESADNIIPSELCNSRRHRQRPASRESAKHTPGARRTVLQGVRLHNSDYVKEAPASRCEGPAFELPGEAASDKQPPSGATRAPARRGAAHFARASRERQCQDSRAQSAAPWNRHQDSKDSISLETSVQCEQSAALIASLGVGPEPKVVCRSEPATPPSSPFLQCRV